MAGRIQKITLLPAIILFILSILFAVSSLFVVVASVNLVLLILILSLFIGGLTYSIYWGYSWIWARKLHERNSGFLLSILSKNREIGLILLSLGLAIGFWVFQLVWNDVFVWNKDLGLIFFGSRVGEAISLGVGVRVVHYFFLGLTFLLIGLVMVIHRFRSCPYYFGYLGSIYRKDVFPLKCFKCSMKKDCLMTDKRSRI